MRQDNDMGTSHILPLQQSHCKVLTSTASKNKTTSIRCKMILPYVRTAPTCHSTPCKLPKCGNHSDTRRSNKLPRTTTLSTPTSRSGNKRASKTTLQTYHNDKNTPKDSAVHSMMLAGTHGVESSEPTCASSKTDLGRRARPCPPGRDKVAPHCPLSLCYQAGPLPVPQQLGHLLEDMPSQAMHDD